MSQCGWNTNSQSCKIVSTSRSPGKHRTSRSLLQLRLSQLPCSLHVAFWKCVWTLVVVRPSTWPSGTSYNFGHRQKLQRNLVLAHSTRMKQETENDRKGNVPITILPYYFSPSYTAKFQVGLESVTDELPCSFSATVQKDGEVPE